MTEALLLAYLLGSIPFGLLITKAAGFGDIRAIGSGNIGATNVLRTGSKQLAALTLALDILKGWVAVWLAYKIIGRGEQQLVMVSQLAAIWVVVGHIFPIWLKFKGGKGVATAIGALLGLNFWLGLGVIAIWLCIFAAARYSSLSALVSMAGAPLLAFAIGGLQFAWPVLVIAVLVCWRHKDNLRRLLNGTEERIGRIS